MPVGAAARSGDPRGAQPRRGTSLRVQDWQTIRRLFHAALDLPPDEREAFVDAQCADDQRLRETLRLLLQSDQEAGGSRISGVGAPVPSVESLREEPRLPSRIGRYPIERELGRGGWGTVYVAEDPRLKRKIALKVLTSSLAHAPAASARFEREAQLLARLNHPHIATLHSFEREGEVDFITMELVAGDTLAERIAAGRLSGAQALGICRQVAEALEAAHSEGVIHCDLKPTNIKLTPQGRVKVLDFGLARALVDPQVDPDEPVALAAKASSVLGSPGYMSPEQLLGRPLDHRTDIWAFGCVLFECLAGGKAFSGGTALDRIGATLDVEPAWNSLPADLPAALRELIRRCLRKEAGERPASMAEVRMELERSLQPFGGDASSGRRRTRVMGAVGGLLIGLLIAGGFWAYRQVIARAEQIADGTSISVRAPLLGHLWTEEHDSKIGPNVRAPWPGEPSVAYGLGAQGVDGGRLFVRDLGSGRLLWTAAPDLDEVDAVFGGYAEGGAFECIAIRFPDLDGDGRRELLTHHRHDRLFPTIVSAFRRDGERIGFYYHTGHFSEMHIEDLNGDQADEVILAGTNNVRSASGATLVILDEKFFHGMSVDPARASQSPFPDSCKVRIIFPDFEPEYMNLLDQMRLIARAVAVVRSPDGSVKITCDVGPRQLHFTVSMDQWLRPYHASPSDDLQLAAGGWPGDLGRRFLGREFRAAWLASCCRCGAGIQEQESGLTP
ncbi:MAG: protein kinase [Candidatus Eisenbacteria bacterium]|nr:protein kinase [Candidatus Eisenbacteria bacterium]